MVDDDGEGSFKKPGAVPFNWEIRPGIPKTRDPTPDDDVPSLLHPPRKLSPLRLKQLPPSSPPSSPKPRAVSPFAPPPYFKAKTPPASGPPPPFWRSSSARVKLDSGSALPRWRLLKSLIGMKKSKSRDVKKIGEDSDDLYESGTTFSPSEGSSRGSVATSWSSQQSSSSSSSSSSSLKRNESDLSSSERKVILMMAREHLG
ncbi:hypothetical protein N665_0824s0027 [Sinapis alba]|nr:hypothetical protein N665_0824s0027 [Sinapis alba]